MVDYYFDFVNGSDGNSGNEGSPFQNPWNKDSLIQGNRFLLKSGQRFRVPSTWVLSGKSLFEWNSYSTGAIPILTCYKDASSGWTFRSGSIWENTGFNKWGGISESVTKIDNNSIDGSNFILENIGGYRIINQKVPWNTTPDHAIFGPRIRLQGGATAAGRTTGGKTNPLGIKLDGGANVNAGVTTCQRSKLARLFIDDVPQRDSHDESDMGGTDAQGPQKTWCHIVDRLIIWGDPTGKLIEVLDLDDERVLQLTNCDDYSFKNIEFHGFIFQNDGTGTATRDNIETHDCTIKRSFRDNIQWAGDNNNTRYNNLSFKRNTCDQQLAILETLDRADGQAEGVSIHSNCSNAIFEANVIKDYTHGNLHLRSAGSVGQVNCNYQYNSGSCANVCHGRDITISQGAGSNLNIRWNIGTNTRSNQHLSLDGSTNHYYGNLKDRVIGDGQPAGSMPNGIGTGINLILTKGNKDGGLYAHNTIWETQAASIMFQGGATTVKNYRFVNNICYNGGNDRSLSRDQGRCLEFSNNTNQTDHLLDFNVFWSDLTTSVVRYKAVNYTVAGAEAFLPESGNDMQNNVNADPPFVDPANQDFSTNNWATKGTNLTNNFLDTNDDDLDDTLGYIVAVGPAPPPPDPDPPPANETIPVRLNLGGNAQDYSPPAYEATRGFSGLAQSIGDAISGTTEDEVFQTRLVGGGQAIIGGSYLVSNATYKLPLLFAEHFHTAANGRLFNIDINGVRVETDLDIWNEVGQFAALIKEYVVVVTTGQIDITLTPTVDNALICGLIIDEDVPPASNPLTVKDTYLQETEINSAARDITEAENLNGRTGTSITGNSVTVVSIANQVNCTATLSNGVVTFTPDAGFSGYASYDLTVNDQDSNADTYTVYIGVYIKGLLF